LLENAFESRHYLACLFTAMQMAHFIVYLAFKQFVQSNEKLKGYKLNAIWLYYLNFDAIAHIENIYYYLKNHYPTLESFLDLQQQVGILLSKTYELFLDYGSSS
jgi:hypothetical protein